MQLLLITFLLFSFSNNVSNQKWGQNGHRVVGEIASHYLTPKTKKAVHNILGDESMAIASNWMDEIKSDPKYDETHDWHWVTIPDSIKYENTEKNPNGDIIWALRTIISKLKKGNLPPDEEKNSLKMLIHLVGDIHQPLHVGNGKDQGGNQVRVEWFWESSNLHRVWDSGMIDQKKISYTELATSINHPSKIQIKKWENSDILDWAQESMKLRDEVYDFSKNKNLNYDYLYHNWNIVEKRLLQAGVRLAGILNNIYG